MRGKYSVLTVAALLVAVAAGPAHAELNLWISYQFTAVDSFGDGDYHDAERLLSQAAGETHKDFRKADTLDKLGRVYAALGQFDKSDSFFTQALDLKEGSLGSEHHEVATILNNLADLRYLKGDKGSCEKLYRRALSIDKRDQFSVDVCRALNGLALLQCDANNLVEAEKLLTHAVDLHVRGQRRDDPFLATVLTNLGILYTNEKRYPEAEKALERAAYIQGVSLKPEHPDVAVRLHATAALYEATDRRAEAVVLSRQAEAMRKKQTDKSDLY